MISSSKNLLLCVIVFTVTGCLSTDLTTGSSDQRRLAITEMREAVLQELYADKPGLWADVEGASGYAVFSDSRALVGVANVGNGVGVVRNNLTGNDTFMNRTNRGVGLGFSKTDRSTIIIFNNESALSAFLTDGRLDISEKTGAVAIHSLSEGLRLGVAWNRYQHSIDSAL